MTEWKNRSFKSHDGAQKALPLFMSRIFFRVKCILMHSSVNFWQIASWRMIIARLDFLFGGADINLALYSSARCRFSRSKFAFVAHFLQRGAHKNVLNCNVDFFLLIWMHFLYCEAATMMRIYLIPTSCVLSWGKKVELWKRLRGKFTVKRLSFEAA